MRRIGIICWVLLGFVPVAHAYILPCDALLLQWAEARRAAPLKDVTLTMDADLAGRDHPVDERYYIKKPERARLVQQDDTQSVIVDREGVRASGEDKQLKVETEPSPNLFVALLLPRGRNPEEMQARMLHTLQSVGIDTKVVSFGRFNQNPVYIIGAQPWEPTKPQVWLDKNALAPVRYMIVQKGHDKPMVIDTRLLGYGQGPGGPVLPHVFEEYQDGKLLRHAEVTAATFNQDLPETLFEWGRHR